MGYIHPTVIVDPGAVVDASASVWHFSHLRAGAVVEPEVSLASSVYVDKDVVVSRGTRVQNGVSIYSGIHMEPWCFIGPHVTFTNDVSPRAGKKHWKMIPTFLKTGMSIGAGSVIRCGVTIGAFSLVGAGAIVTKDVPPFHLVTGQPAEQKGMVCACGDTHLPLETRIADLIRACCEGNLRTEVLQLAKKARDSL